MSISTVVSLVAVLLVVLAKGRGSSVAAGKLLKSLAAGLIRPPSSPGGTGFFVSKKDLSQFLHRLRRFGLNHCNDE